MSELETVILEVLQRDIEAAAAGEGDRYPLGKKKWVERYVGMAIREILQWLHDPKKVNEHLETVPSHGCDCFECKHGK